MDGGEASRQVAERRLLLLKESLASAQTATELNPNSLSSAALRCTLVVNLLVEESSPLNGANATDSSGHQRDRDCARIKQEFQGALAACSKAMLSPQPTLLDPVINIVSDGTSARTCDPCSLVSSGGRLTVWSTQAVAVAVAVGAYYRLAWPDPLTGYAPTCLLVLRECRSRFLSGYGMRSGTRSWRRSAAS